MSLWFRVPAVVFALILGGLYTYAQAPPAKSEARTQLEEFLATTGSILIKVYHPLDAIPSNGGGSSLGLSALVLYEPGKKSEGTRGIKAKVYKGDGKEYVSFLDIDEIDNLLEGIEYMQKIMVEWAGTKRDYTEMVFSTRGDFAVGFYINNEGKIQAFAKVGTIGSGNIFLRNDGLQKLRDSLNTGLQYLQSN